MMCVIVTRESGEKRGVLVELCEVGRGEWVSLSVRQVGLYTHAYLSASRPRYFTRDDVCGMRCDAEGKIDVRICQKLVATGWARDNKANLELKLVTSASSHV